MATPQEHMAEMMAKIAAISPEMKQRVEDASGFTTATKAQNKLKSLLDQMIVDDPSIKTDHLLFALVKNTVLTAYINFDGDRAVARDKLDAAIDAAMDVVDDTSRKNGMHAMLRKIYDARKRGDGAALKRMNEELEGR